MSLPQHKELAAGRWQNLSFLEQMANIGSEVERTLSWKTKGNLEYSQKAFIRSLELIDLTLSAPLSFSRLKEVARMREAIVDFFCGENIFCSTDILWRKYFLPFAYATRRHC